MNGTSLPPTSDVYIPSALSQVNKHSKSNSYIIDVMSPQYLVNSSP